METKNIAKEVVFCPIVRVVIPKGREDGSYHPYNKPANIPNTEDEYATMKAIEKLRSWSKEEILEWLDENVETIVDSPEECE